MRSNYISALNFHNDKRRMSVAKKPVLMQAPPSTTLSNVDSSQINEVKDFVKNEIAKYSDMLAQIEKQEGSIEFSSEPDDSTQRRQLSQLVSNLAFLKDKLYPQPKSSQQDTTSS
jgi:hypothetical protein